MADEQLLARLLRQGGARLLDLGVARVVPETGSRPRLTRRIVHAALLRVATRSVPGAIVVGGGLLAHHLHLRRKERLAKRASSEGTGSEPQPDVTDASPGATHP